MSNHLLGFPNKKERDDFLIAIAVILLFIWLFWYMLMGRETPDLNKMVPPVAAVIADVDSDNDGILDADDNCPNLAGIAANRGCPSDADNDGIYDANDRCPELAGVEANEGCPADSDGDGVYDRDDACPNIKFVSKSGCPPDSDGDGIFDHLDECPNIKGDPKNNGCPFNKKELVVLDNLKSVEFEKGRSILKPKSQSDMDELVTILDKNRSTNISIEGHTDASGGEEGNLKLSKQRAEACKAYLISKGINGSRLRATGFGENRLLPGKTPEDPSHRRVIFKPY